MTLFEQARQRVTTAEQLGRRPTRWIATTAVAADVGDQLEGLPVAVGEPRSEWGLQLLVEPA